MISHLVHQKIDYGWNQDTYIAVTVPILSSYILRTQAELLREPIPLPENVTLTQMKGLIAPRAKAINNMQAAHFFGFLVQMVSFIALSILLHPLFMIPAGYALGECLIGAFGLMRNISMILSEDQRLMTIES